METQFLAIIRLPNRNLLGPVEQLPTPLVSYLVAKPGMATITSHQYPFAVLQSSNSRNVPWDMSGTIENPKTSVSP